MKKLKRVLSFIITGAMVLSLMPTFAMATEGSTYTYAFNPAEDTSATTYTADTHTYATTVKNAAGESVYAPWAYADKYNQNTNYPQTEYFKDTFSMYTRSKLNGWIALKIQILESGVYDAKLFYTAYSACGGFNIYLLPIETELPEGACDFSASYAEHQLNTDVVSLYASPTKANQSAEITTKKDITASKNGAEFYLVFQAVKSSKEYGSGSDAYYAYLESLTLTKTAGVSVPKTDADYFESEASYGYGASYSELNDYVSVGNIAAGNVGSAEKGTTLTLKAQKEVKIDDTTYKFVGWKRGGTGVVTDALSFTSYVSSSNEDTFTLWANTYLTAVYDKTDDTAEKTVELYNQDGTFLTSATADEIASLEEMPEVSLLGHTFEKWQYINENGEEAEFTPETELHETVTRVVAKQTPKKVKVTFEAGENGDETVTPTVASKEFDYGKAVSTDEFYAMPDSKAYWSRDGLVTRTQADYSFYAWADTVLKPVFVTAIPTELCTPKVIVDETDSDGAYMIEWDVHSNASYTIVEAGILFSNTENVTLSTFAGEKYTSQKNGTHGQLAAKPDGAYSNVRGYVIYKDNTDGDIGVAYSDDVTVSE